MIHDKKGTFMHKEKVLPVMAMKVMDYFSYNDSSFAIQKCKESTGRVSTSYLFIPSLKPTSGSFYILPLLQAKSNLEGHISKLLSKFNQIH